MTLLSQRDKRWANIKLGWGDITIGESGCLITALAMLWNTTPDIVNEWLKNNNGFINLNLVNWQALPGFEWRGWTYENQKILDTIKKYGSCIVETDFNTNQKDGSHFVVFTGDKKLNDPWTGKQQATSYFPVYYGYAIIDPSKNPIKGGNMPDEMMQISIKDFEKIRGNSEKWDKIVSYCELSGDPALTPYEDVMNKIKGYKARETELSGKIKELEATVINREEQVSRLKGQLLEEQKLYFALSNNLKNATKNHGKAVGLLEGRIKDLQGQVDQMGKEKGKLNEEIKELEAKAGFTILVNVRPLRIGIVKW